MNGAVMVSPTQYVDGEKVTDGADGVVFTVRVTVVGGPSHPDAFVSTTYTDVVFAVALLKPKAPFVGFVPVKTRVVSPASLNHVYVLLPTGLVTDGLFTVSPTQYELGLKVIGGADGTAFTVNMTATAGPSQPEEFVSAT